MFFRTPFQAPSGSCTEVRNLKRRGRVRGVNLDLGKHLFYLSLHILSNEVTFAYGKKRIYQECVDDFLTKQLVVNGISFDDSGHGYF